MPAIHFIVWICLSKIYNISSWIFLVTFIHTFLYVFSLLVKMFFPSSSTSISFLEAFGFGLSLRFYISTWKDFWLFVCSTMQLWVTWYSRCSHGNNDFWKLSTSLYSHLFAICFLRSSLLSHFLRQVIEKYIILKNLFHIYCYYFVEEFFWTTNLSYSQK